MDVSPMITPELWLTTLWVASNTPKMCIRDSYPVRVEVGLFQRGGGHPVDHMGKPRRPRLAILVHLAVTAIRRDLDVQPLAHIPGVAGKGCGKQRSR